MSQNAPPMSSQVLWRQFGAAIDMLESSIHRCPDELWSDPSRAPTWQDRDVVGFWYVAFHTLFWLDLYLSGSVVGFRPPQPFGLEELDPEGRLPERPYSRAELLGYLEHCRAKCRSTLAALDDQAAGAFHEVGWGRLTFLELILYNLRHLQHHTGQLNLLLRQQAGIATEWVAFSRDTAPGSNRR